MPAKMLTDWRFWAGAALVSFGIVVSWQITQESWAEFLSSTWTAYKQHYP